MSLSYESMADTPSNVLAILLRFTAASGREPWHWCGRM